MEIFHYVADQLTGVPLFEGNIMEEIHGPMIGAAYNDYDRESPFQNVLTPSLEPSSSPIVDPPLSSIINEEDVDYALLEADGCENIFDIHTCGFTTENFDNSSIKPDSEYYSKVILI